MPATRYIAGAVAAGAATLSLGLYAASAEPRRQDGGGATLFAPGVMSTGAYELAPTFTADGNTAYYTVSTPEYGRMRYILEVRRTAGGGWGTPRMASFSGRYDDADPFVAPDGRMFFLSKRPPSGDGPQERDLDIWVADRQGSGWGEPRHLGPVVNGEADEHYVTVTRDGTLYIAAIRPDSRGRGDVYRVPREGDGWGAPENLGPVVNGAEFHDTTPFVAPDERYVIFASRGRPDAVGGIDLYITMRRDGEWTAPRNLGPSINSAADDYCPIVSPDGRFLYFSSERSFADSTPTRPRTWADLSARLSRPGNSLGDIYRVPMAEVLRAAGEGE